MYVLVQAIELPHISSTYFKRTQGVRVELKVVETCKIP